MILPGLECWRPAQLGLWWGHIADPLHQIGHSAAHQEDGTTRCLISISLWTELQEADPDQFDDRKGPTWHCIVGRNFGSFVTHGTVSPPEIAFSYITARLTESLQKPSTSYTFTLGTAPFCSSRRNRGAAPDRAAERQRVERQQVEGPRVTIPPLPTVLPRYIVLSRFGFERSISFGGSA
jgi:hypothetical protein